MKAIHLWLWVCLALLAQASLRKRVRRVRQLQEEQLLSSDSDTNSPADASETPEAADAADEHPPQECRLPLLYSYGVLSAGAVNRTSELCGDAIVSTCCTKTSEDVIMNFWKNVNRVKIKQYIEGYVWLFKGILNHYQLYKLKAQKVLEYPGSPSTCKQHAESFIASYLDRSDIEKYTTTLIKAYENLADTRKAFYCALCNADSQEFFNLQERTVTFSQVFCHKLVANTMEQIWTRNEVYMTIFNSMNVLAECDPNSEYDPEPYSVDMRMGVADANKVQKCYDSYVTKDQKDPRVFFDDCSDFCGGYSLTAATELFEGNFAKLYYLFRKLRQFGEAINIKQMIFEQVDVTEQYDFSMVSTEFFEANMRNVRFEKFAFLWDRRGLDYFYIASRSKTYFDGAAGVVRGVWMVGLAVLALLLGHN